MTEPMTLTVFDQAKQAVGDIALPSEIFAGPVRRSLLHDTVKMQRANRRAGNAATKTRGLVSGGGAKPWRQKGTGRARAGSNRSPLWVGGATIFGPTPRDYSYRLPKSARKVALRSVLALKAREGKLMVLDRITVDPPKTKVVAGLLKALEVSSALLVTPGRNEHLERAARNLPGVKVLRAEGLNAYDVLRFEHLILERDVIDILKSRVTA
jgi:large subunit ribosomal protein L4